MKGEEMSKIKNAFFEILTDSESEELKDAIKAVLDDGAIDAAVDDATKKEESK